MRGTFRLTFRHVSSLFLFVCLLSTCVSVSLLQAQTAPAYTSPSPASQLPEPAKNGSDSDTVIGPGDLLEVRVFGVPELSGSFRVSGRGTLDIPLIGGVATSGLSASALAARISNSFVGGGFILNPQVTVRVLELGTQGITVGGEVQHPGIYPMFAPRSLRDAIALASGFTEQADRRVRVQHRRTHREEVVDLSSQGTTSTNAETVSVYPGDEISVPRAGIIYVLGEVVRPGGIVMRNGGRLTLLEALAEAQGPRRTASLQHSFVLHKSGDTYTRVALPLKDYMKGQKGVFELVDQDVLVVSGSSVKIFFADTSALIGTIGGAGLYALAAR